MKLRHFLVAAVVVSTATVAISSSMAAAGTNCAAGGTCLWSSDSPAYTGGPYRNTVGHIANLATVGWDNTARSVSDSTSSPAYQGVALFESPNCTGRSIFVGRGSQTAAAGLWPGRVPLAHFDLSF